MDDFPQAAEHRPDDLGRHVLPARHPVQSCADELLEGVGRLVYLLDRARPRGVDLDEAHPRRRRLLDDQADDRFEGDSRLLLAQRPTVGFHVGDRPDGRADEGIQSGQQAVFLVAEVLVEGAPRHP